MELPLKEWPITSIIGAPMPIDMEAVELEMLYWKPTGELRFVVPAGHTRDEATLEQLWERVTGERAWRIVPVVIQD